MQKCQVWRFYTFLIPVFLAYLWVPVPQTWPCREQRRSRWSPWGTCRVILPGSASSCSGLAGHGRHSFQLILFRSPRFYIIVIFNLCRSQLFLFGSPWVYCFFCQLRNSCCSPTRVQDILFCIPGCFSSLHQLHQLFINCRCTLHYFCSAATVWTQQIRFVPSSIETQ